MTTEYAKLRAAMKAWYSAIDVPVIQIVHFIDEDGEVEIAGYADFPKFRQLIVDEIKDARRYFDWRDEQGPITASIVYSSPGGPLSIFMNGMFWRDVDEDGVS